MTTPPPKPKSWMVFWLATIAVLSGIAATVLLANDMQNMKAIARHYHSTIFDHGKVAIAQQILTVRSPRIDNRLPPHLLEGVMTKPSSFVRIWRLRGEVLCQQFAMSNAATAKWHSSSFDSSTYECSFETRPAAVENAADQASLFVIVRGTEFGKISTVRIKLIAPPSQYGDAMRKQFIAVVRTLMAESRWGNATSAIDTIGKFENTMQSAFGVRLRFSHEFRDANRFNLIVDRDAQMPEQRRTENFFDRAKWLPMPPSLAKW